MKSRYLLLLGVLLWCAIQLLVAQSEGQGPSGPPERLLYFPDTGRNYAALDPGQEILQRNLLISNQMSGYNVSFDLSFDEAEWSGFALGPRYSSIFSLKGQNGCYIRIRTFLQKDKPPLVVQYYLIRGKCYSVYWNKEDRRWDLVENACRAY